MARFIASPDGSSMREADIQGSRGLDPDLFSGELEYNGIPADRDAERKAALLAEGGYRESATKALKVGSKPPSQGGSRRSNGSRRGGTNY